MTVEEETREGFYLSEEGDWVPDGWIVGSLGNNGEVQAGHAFKSQHMGEEGIPLVKITEIQPPYVNMDSAARVDPGPYSKKDLRKFEIRFGDSLVAMTGATIGKVGKYLSDEVSWLNQRVAKISSNDSTIDSFIHYVLKSPVFSRHVENTSSGSSAQQNVSGGDLESYSFFLPPLPEQKAIAAVLGSLDDKIELLREQNETLEALAQTLFKRWFFDFNFPDENGNPYKDSGGKMITSELGEIPDGWQVDRISSHVETISKTFPLNERDEVIFLNTGDIQNGDFLHANYSRTEGLPGQAKKAIMKGDILFSEIRPENHRHAYVDFDAPDHVVSTKLMVLRQKSDLDIIFTYFFLRQKESIDHLQMMAESRSGTFPQITFTTLDSLLIALPYDMKKASEFSTQVLNPFAKKRQSNTQQIQTLTQLRDTLLPKLMKGEIRIKQ